MKEIIKIFFVFIFSIHIFANEKEDELREKIKKVDNLIEKLNFLVGQHEELYSKISKKYSDLIEQVNNKMEALPEKRNNFVDRSKKEESLEVKKIEEKKNENESEEKEKYEKEKEAFLEQYKK